MSTCFAYTIAEEKEKLELLIKLKGSFICTSWLCQQGQCDARINQPCGVSVQDNLCDRKHHSLLHDTKHTYANSS